MTTIFEDPNLGKPGTHVLAIGVGHYPHLIDGSASRAKQLLGLGQLSSPPISTQAFLDWTLAPLLSKTPGFMNAAMPLASVEAVISGQKPITVPAPGGPIQVGPADLLSIETAFRSWLNRLINDPGSMGIFYYCGHGLSTASQFLLAEDFGEDDYHPWAKAFDVTRTYQAVIREIHGPLYFLVDACREVSRDIALTLDADPSPLKDVDLRKAVICPSYSMINATGEGKLAFALDGKISRFTEALLTSLSGYCGLKTPGAKAWSVDGESLGSAVRVLLQNGNKSPDRRQVSTQQIAGVSMPILQLNRPPMVKVEVDLLPEPLRSLANLYLKPAGGTQIQHDGNLGALVTEVPRGIYDFGALPKAGAFPPVAHEGEEFTPPHFAFTMQVEP